MGSFNVSCGASHLTINSGDKIVLFPLTINKEYTNDCNSSNWSKQQNPYYKCTNFVTNEGPFGICHPLTLPIFGEYNDYGCLENIEKNEHTEYLEEYYGITIQNIADYFCRAEFEGDEIIKDWSKPKYSNLRNMAGMFVLREVYDGYVKASFKDLKMNYYEEASMTSSTLKLMGFEFVEEIEKGRYNKIYKHPTSDDYVMMCDGEYSHIGKINCDKDGKTIDYSEVENCTYHPSYVDGHWKRLTGQKTNWDFLKTVSVFHDSSLDMHECFKKVEVVKDIPSLQTELIKLKEDEKGNADKISELSIKLSKLYILEMRLDMGNDMSQRFWGKVFVKLYQNLFVDNHECIAKLMNDYHLFHHMMFASNKLFIPTMNGFQQGCRESDVLVNKIALGVANKRNQEWIDDNTCVDCGGVDDNCTCE